MNDPFDALMTITVDEGSKSAGQDGANENRGAASDGLPTTKQRVSIKSVPSVDTCRSIPGPPRPPNPARARPQFGRLCALA